MSKDTTLQTAAEHYESLRGYLASHIQKLMRESGQVKSRSATARDKLMKLNKSQFQELSTDVYDEMTRRTDEHALPFLPVRDDFHPKRNQARQKLATLSTNRFKDLATDIYYEIERRFPSVTKSIQERMPFDNQQQYSPQQYSPQQYQYPERNMDNRYPLQDRSPQDKYTRERSRERGERDRDRDRMRDREYSGRDREREYSQRKESTATPPDYPKSNNSPAVNVSSLDNLMADIGNMLTSPIGNKDSSNEINQLKKEHENEINKMQEEIDELKGEIQDLKASLEEKTNALEVSEEKVKKMQSDYDAKEKECKDLLEEKEKLAKDLDELDQEHRNLQEDYESREQMAKDIRQEVANLLDEIKELQQKNEELKADKEKNEEIIRKLKEGQEVKEDNLSHHDSPKDKSPKDKSSSARNELKKILDDIRPGLRNGTIREDRIDDYEDAVNNLLDAKEGEKPTNVLVAMKDIVISCKTITEDIESFEQSVDLRSEEREHLDVLKNYLSESLTNLMTSAKSYATSQGKTLDPKLEDSVLTLTDTVVDLIRYTKDLSSGNSPRKDNYTRKDNYHGGSSKVKTVPQLRDFIKDNTDKIVVSIQSLLYNLRQSNTFDNEFLDIVNGITSIVDEIINESHDTLDSLSASEYKPDIEDILLELTNSNSKLDELGQKMISSPQSKSTKQQIASASYDIANFVKNLISNLK